MEEGAGFSRRRQVRYRRCDRRGGQWAALRDIAIALALNVEKVHLITDLGLVGGRFTRYVIVVPVNEILLTC